MSQRVSENGENRKMLLHDRNWRYCREHSQKLHTNEKLHARERLWSESHFRLVNLMVTCIKISMRFSLSFLANWQFSMPRREDSTFKENAPFFEIRTFPPERNISLESITFKRFPNVFSFKLFSIDTYLLIGKTIS